MATNKLFPAFFRFMYQSPDAIHTQTRTLSEITSSGAGDPGTVVAWNTSVVATDTMVEAYLDAWLGYQSDDVETLSYIIYRVPSPLADPEPLWESAYANPGGIVALTGRRAGVQHTMLFRTANFGLMKVVSLDRASGGVLGYSSPLSTEEATFRDYVLGETHALTGHDDGQPVSFKNLIITMNDRLMRSYGNNSV